MIRSIALVAFAAVFLAACTGEGTIPMVLPGGSPGPTSAAAPSRAPASPVATPTTTLAAVPAGRILFERHEADGLEHYYTVDTDGTNEHALFTADGCDCARWAPDGARVWTMGATGHGTWSFTTMRPDGGNRVVIDPPIETLNLGPATPSVDGRWIAFDAWDETDPTRNGLYLGSPDLADLRLVTPLPEGTDHVDPFGVTPDGLHILFMAERADEPHEAGDLYAVNADGSGLRQLNPPGTTLNLGVAPASLSPDGRQAAFGVEDAVFTVDMDGGKVRSITDRGGYVWAVSWSPTGEWIAYTRQHGTTSVVSLVRPDGTDQKEISATDGSDEVAGGAWSPNGDALLVLRGPDARHDLWIIDLEGTFMGQVTHEPADYGTYSWAPASGF